MGELTEEDLRRMYLEELLTESEIAVRCGTYQVKVGRMRRKFGIPTLGKTGRLQHRLPPLTEEQRQLVVGSLLGDGWMGVSSARSARFSDSHKAEHAPYVEWKAKRMGKYTSSLRWGSKTDRQTGRVYQSRGFSTHSCPQLRPYYDLFYPAPLCVRVFPSDLHKRLTPFALAVWYMDDGSLSNGHPRIHFGLDDLSLKRALRALRALGLHIKVYGEGGNRTLWFPRKELEFRHLIEPHMCPVMGYKLPPVRRVRRRKDANARKLTEERAASFYQGGASVGEIASLFKVGNTTVKRRLEAAGVPMRGPGPRALGYSTEAAEALLGERGSDMGVGEIMRILRASPFPAPIPLETKAVGVALEKVKGADMRLEDGVVSPIRRVGIGCCTSFFPNRYRAMSRGSVSAYEAWFRDKDLGRAVRFQLKVGDPVTPRRVLRAVTMNCRTPTVFRPTVARFVYERCCPRGGRVWDPCAGYGGRLLGAAAAGVEYIGTEVDPETVEGNTQLAQHLGSVSVVHHHPAEMFTLPEGVDLVFTSPPYYDRELYSQREDQSWVRYGDSFESWVEGFLRPILQQASAAPCLVLNVADIRSGKDVIPLVNTVIRVATEEGFKLEETLYLPLSQLNRGKAREPLLVFTR